MLCQFSCIPILAFSSSTSCCNCIYHAAHFSAPRGLSHSLHINCNVGSWLVLYPVFQASCCCFLYAVICCGVLVKTNFVMWRACSYTSAVDAPSCISCVLLCGIAFPRNFCCRYPPSRFLCRDRLMHTSTVDAGPIDAAAQSP